MSRSAAQILEDLGTDLPVSLAQILQEAADAYIEEAKSRMNFDQNSSDGVRATIRAVVEESTMTLGIVMPEHGYFQNFGVVSYEGKGDNKDQETIDEATAEAFGSSPNTYMKFGTGNYSTGGRPWGAYYSGLNAKRFFDIEEFTDQVAEYVQENLEL